MSNCITCGAAAADCHCGDYVSGEALPRAELIAMLAKDVAEAADYSRVGTVNIFGDTVTVADIDDAVRAAIERLQKAM